MSLHKLVSQLPYEPHYYQRWYIACTSQELRQKPISRTLLGVPLVLFRTESNSPTALVDRCPHRNMPLSDGRMQRSDTGDSRLVCPYHGWQFDGKGRCKQIPGLCSLAEKERQNAIAYPTQEQQGFIWVYLSSTADGTPTDAPYRFPLQDDPKSSTFSWQMAAPISLANAAENFLDATHTHFVHAGLVRTEKRRRKTMVKVCRTRTSAEA
ncbi:MAG: aromatic ring-hydroxylating dioxygenase subunit alpha, partial [Pseudomonadota bacterium]